MQAMAGSIQFHHPSPLLRLVDVALQCALGVLAEAVQDDDERSSGARAFGLRVVGDEQGLTAVRPRHIDPPRIDAIDTDIDLVAAPCCAEERCDECCEHQAGCPSAPRCAC